jgi:hypothetical protein
MCTALALPAVLTACGDGTTPSEPSVAAPSADPTTSGPVSSPTAATASAGTTAGPAPTGGPVGSTTVTVLRSGGIAGVMQQLKIEPNGTWRYLDKRGGQTQQGQLSAAQRQELTQLVSSPAFIAEIRQAPPPGVCNDGFVYAVTVGELSFRYEQCGGKGNRPTIDSVLRLVQGATPM